MKGVKMKKHLLQFFIIAMTIIFGSVMNATAFDFIAKNDYWQKKGTPYGAEEENVVLPAIGNILTDYPENYSVPNDLYNISDNERNNLYASSLFHQTNMVSNLAQTNTDTSDAGFNFGRLHKYLGYSTLILAGIAAVSSSDRSVHYGSAYAATGTALATCLTGYSEYGDRFNLDDGLFSEDNLHIILGVIGTLGFATAVAIADSGKETSHSGFGRTSAASMVISVIVIKW
jgi:hypothetical protein